MRILITNDDGIASAGLRRAVRVCKEFGDVLVVAPATQQSGVGRSVSLLEPVRVEEIEIEGVEALAISGTPADAVLIGSFAVSDDPPDLVVSGINLGENLSADITTSGTVGAALEAYGNGIPAFAVSQEVRDVSVRLGNGADDDVVDFHLVEEVLRALLEAFEENPDWKGILNVNVPEPERWNGKVKVAPLAPTMYEPRIEERYDPRGRRYYWIDGRVVDDPPEGTDLAELMRGSIVITPLTTDITARDPESLATPFLESVTDRLQG
ncbi:MAG: 5'/3'-nucleotidase SurE [Methanopyri archaeon]|nr:5'/3'-nucleotidase SurE [Methanopyri archaeon]